MSRVSPIAGLGMCGLMAAAAALADGTSTGVNPAQPPVNPGQDPVFADLPLLGPPDTLEAVVASPVVSTPITIAVGSLPPSTTVGPITPLPTIFPLPPIVENGTPPVLTVHPESQSVTTGASVTFTAAATGTPAPVYVWSWNGRFIAGANAASYTIASASPANAGAYSVEVYNGAGFATSNVATLSVASPGVVTAAPKNLTIATGATAAFSVTTAGAGLTYQWQFNGLPIPGATTSSFAFANAGPGASGTFAVAISSGTTLVAEEAASLSVVTNARLTNLSARGLVGTGDEVLIVGFVSSGTGTKQMLLRGVGPTLASAFGVSGALATPELTLYGATGNTIASNSGWGGTTALMQAFSQVGAFPLPVGSADAALLETLPTGANTVQVTGVNGAAGIALAELYDADTGTPTATLANISARAYVANGGNVLIAGIVISGPSSETLLIRGVGPTLGMLFGFPNALLGTQVALFDSKGNQITANAGWGNDPWISVTGAQVGAFPLQPGSLDSALLVTIPPGAYTAQLTGANGATGLGMVEIYEVR